jgi:DNA repair ATPase RecN
MGQYSQTTVNVRADQLEWLQSESINTSELIRKLLDGYTGGDTENATIAALEMRLEAIDDKLERIELEGEQLAEEREAIVEQLDRIESSEEQQASAPDVLPRAHKKFAGYPPSKLGSSQSWINFAEENGYGAMELKDMYLEYRQSLVGA